MKTLFEVDSKDYASSSPVVIRNSARGIHLLDGKLLLMHLPKYQAYKLPGGGIEPGESPKDALIREFREESGRIVVPSSIRPFGLVVMRRAEERGEGVFQQGNYHFLCDVEETVERQSLDAYEEELQFQPVYLPIQEALRYNKKASRGRETRFLTREIMVMEYLLKWLESSRSR